jgi:sarcosine oxidase gamma subunit
MKQTPFTDLHIKLGAKMHEFAGYNMPIEYSGIIDEHQTVVNSVGVFDVSHMGEFWVKGPKAVEFLQRVTSNDVTKLQLGKAQYTCFVNENGGIVDDFIVYYYEPEKYLMVVNAANIEKDWEWCVKWNTMGAELENASDHMAQLAVQGPNAKATLQKLTEENLSDIPFYEFSRSVIQKALNKAFAPEFLNRVDDIVMFDQLSKESIYKIIDLELEGLYKRIGDLGFKINLTETAKEFIANKGYDIQFGARPLKRAIQKYIEDELAEKIISTGMKEGDTVIIDFDEEKQQIIMNKAEKVLE